ncbi:hypothetical protein ACFL03_10945 [Thermodesulfobacteriota bacterium]
MNKIIVQIYEVQTPSEAEILIELGVDHIGSVILSAEKWKRPPLKDTIHAIEGSNSRSSLIPLFSDMDCIFRSLEYYMPDIVHFCETLTDYDDLSESCERLLTLQENVKKRFPDIKIMRSIPIPQEGMADVVSTLKLAQMFEPMSDYFLTDTLIVRESKARRDHQPVNGFIGITGKTCDWNTAAKLVESSRIPVILAGGISPDNVYDGILNVRPAGVDSCTRTNAIDVNGDPIRFKKDPEKVSRFVKETRRAEKHI